AGATADAFTLFERFEGKLKDFNKNLARAAVELAKDWRTDRFLRRLEALLVVADKERTLILSGTGDVVEPDEGVAAIGSGGPYAQPAASVPGHGGDAGRGDAEEHHPRGADRRGEDGDRPAAGAACRRSVRQGGGLEVHRGGVRRQGRGLDDPRPGGSGRLPGARGAAERGAAPRRRARGRTPAR